MKTAILDYGSGNIRSVQNALNRIGVESFVSDDLAKLATADKLIFPGVGSAGFAMDRLKEKGLDAFLKNYEKPLLGICLGMQLMFDFLEEDKTAGLGIFAGNCQKFDDKKCSKIPHMGWNSCRGFDKQLFTEIPRNFYVYFVHSYFVPITKDTIATCNYGGEFSAAVRKNNFWGTQFHPEKSGDIGEKILKNFLNI